MRVLYLIMGLLAGQIIANRYDTKLLVNLLESQEDEIK